MSMQQTTSRPPAGPGPAELVAAARLLPPGPARIAALTEIDAARLLAAS